jgi:pentatricopeptide repeat protein
LRLSVFVCVCGVVSAGLVKSVAAAGRPGEALELLEGLLEGGEDVLQHSAMYHAMLLAVADRLRDKGCVAYLMRCPLHPISATPNTPSSPSTPTSAIGWACELTHTHTPLLVRVTPGEASELGEVQERTLALMAGGGVAPTRRIWLRLLQTEAALGRPAEVRRLAEQMRAQGASLLGAEYGLLMEAYGRVGDVGGVEAAAAEARAKGVTFDHALYRCLLGAYGRCGDWQRAQAAFEEMRAAGVRFTVKEETAIMQVGARGVADRVCVSCIPPPRLLIHVVEQSMWSPIHPLLRGQGVRLA